MIITYFRSSSYNTWDFCNQQYYLSYVLGLPELSNKKADKGTIVHKIMEELALDNHHNLGRLYKTDEQVNSLVDKTYHYYTSRIAHHQWKPLDLKHCRLWTWKVLDFHGGAFDPRQRDIVDVEPRFDFEITKPWAMYHYKIDDQPIDGFLSLKGTIDQISKVDDNCYEILDWKTGRRLDWATQEVKTLDKLHNDPQLLLYYYAAHQLYPDIQYFIVTIYFINDGGPFSVCFDDKSLKKAEQLLKHRFHIIKNTHIPRLNRSWKCTKLCHYGKNTFEDTHVEPRIVDGECLTQCKQIQQDVMKIGMDNTTAKYKHPDHTIGKYSAPGEV